MENNSESLSLDKNTPLDTSPELLLRFEIPLSSCSNLHLFQQLQIFLQQNKIPIEITTSIPSPSSIQKGGDQDPEKESKSLIYQSGSSTFTIFKSFMDRFFLQKQHENIQDKHNKQLLDSMFSKDKSKKEIIHSLQTLSKNTSRDSKEPETETKKQEPSITPKKRSLPPQETNTLYMHIKTNHNHPIDSIRGTKLYYLYQRQQNAQCAQFV